MQTKLRDKKREGKRTERRAEGAVEKIRNKYLITEKCDLVSESEGRGQNVRGKSMKGCRVDDAEMRTVREE